MADKVLLTTRKFKVVNRYVDTGLGEPVPNDIVLHPGGTVILPITDDGRVVMVRNWRWSINRELLELPAGTIEPLEEPEDCACRELEEETGYSCGKIRPLCRFYSSPGVMTELLYAFLATELQAGQQNLAPDEKITIEIMSFDELDHAIREGQIMDGKTLATLLYYKEMEKG